MLNLTEHKPGNHYVIREVDPDHVVIGDRSFSSSVVVGARLLQENWPVRSLKELTAATVAPLIELQPELVVIGFGSRPSFPDARTQQLFFSRGVGLECMTLNAAARTFNILMSEDRRVLAGLIF